MGVPDYECCASLKLLMHLNVFSLTSCLFIIQCTSHLVFDRCHLHDVCHALHWTHYLVVDSHQSHKSYQGSWENLMISTTENLQSLLSMEDRFDTASSAWVQSQRMNSSSLAVSSVSKESMSWWTSRYPYRTMHLYERWFGGPNGQ